MLRLVAHGSGDDGVQSSPLWWTTSGGRHALPNAVVQLSFQPVSPIEHAGTRRADCLDGRLG